MVKLDDEEQLSVATNSLVIDGTVIEQVPDRLILRLLGHEVTVGAVTSCTVIVCTAVVV